MSKIPALIFVSSTPEVKAGSSKDTVKILFKFEDGDANIATDGNEVNLFVSNTRDTDRFDAPLPPVDQSFKDPVYGFKGMCQLNYPAAFLLLRDTLIEKDSLQFKITLKDQAGNISNEITTPMVYLNK
jgi:hypothetical protein